MGNDDTFLPPRFGFRGLIWDNGYKMLYALQNHVNRIIIFAEESAIQIEQ